MAMGTGAAPRHPDTQPTSPPASTPVRSPCPRLVTAPWPWMPTLGPWGRWRAPQHCCLPCLYPWTAWTSLPGQGGLGLGGPPGQGCLGEGGHSEAPLRWEPQGWRGHPGTHICTPAPFLLHVPATAARGESPHTANGGAGSRDPCAGGGRRTLGVVSIPSHGRRQGNSMGTCQRSQRGLSPPARMSPEMSVTLG